MPYLLLGDLIDKGLGLAYENVIGPIFFSIFLTIDSCIYTILNSIYRVYIALASARIFSAGLFTEIAGRLYAIIGVVTLFVVAYVMIQGIVNPDNFAKSGGTGAGMLKRFAIAVLGLALVPGAFRMAYTAQDIILRQNLIGKIFLGYNNKSNVVKAGEIKVDETKLQFETKGEGGQDSAQINQNDAINTSAGNIVAINIWQAVFYPSEVDSEKKSDEDAEKKFDEAADKIKSSTMLSVIAHSVPALTILGCALAVGSGIFTGGASWLAAAALCPTVLAAPGIAEALQGKIPSLKQAYSAAATTGNFGVFIGFASNVAKGEITYRFLISTAIGVAAAYIFLSFAIDMAVRAVKLAYMEIIAPIPLMLQILPKFKDNFNKWLTTVLSLFMEVFIRLSFVYVVAYLIAHLPTILAGGWLKNADLGMIEGLLARVILIIGMLIFAKTAPKFVSETLGINTGNMSIGIRKKLAEGGVLSVGAAVGGIGANFLSGGAAGAVAGYTGARKWHLLGGAGGLISGAFGRAIMSAPDTIRSAGKVDNYTEVVRRIQDSYRKGQKEDIERRQKKEDITKELKERGYDKDQAGKDGLYNYLSAASARRVDKLKDFVVNDFAALPPDMKRWEGQLKLKATFEELGSKLKEEAAKRNENVKIAQYNRDFLDTDAGRQAAAIKVAEEMAAKGLISKEELDGIKNSAEKRNNFIIGNSNAVNGQLSKERIAADGKVKDAKKRAVNEELEKDYIAGKGSMLDLVHKFNNEHAELFKQYGNTLIEIDENHTTKSANDYMKKLLGEANYETNKEFDKTILGEYAQTDRDLEITGKAGEEKVKGVLKYRNNGTEAYFDDGSGELYTVSDVGKGVLVYDKNGTTRSLSGVEVIKQAGNNRVQHTLSTQTVEANGNTLQLESGGVLDMAQAIAGSSGTIQYTGNGNVQKRVTINTTDSGAVVGKVIEGEIPAQLKLSELTTSLMTGVTGATTGPLIVDGGPSVSVGATINGKKPINVSLSNSGGNVQASIEGISAPISVGSDNISLASIALGGTVQTTDLARTMSLSDGSHTVDVGSKKLDVIVEGGSVKGCKQVVSSGASFADVKGTVGESAAIDVVGTVDAMKPGETIEIKGSGTTSYEIGKAADGSKIYRVKNPDHTSFGVVENITEDAAVTAFSDRREVDIQEVASLAARDREARIKVIAKDSTGADVRSDLKITRDGSGRPNITVLRETSGSISVSDLASNLEVGQHVTFAMPAGQGTVTASNVGGNIEYVVTDPETSTTTSPMNADEFRQNYEIRVDTSSIPDMVTADGSTNITVGSGAGARTITVSNLGSTEMANYGAGDTIIGYTGLSETIQGNGVEGTLKFDNDTTLRIEKDYGTSKYRYVYIDENNNATYYSSKDDLERAHSEVKTAIVTSVTSRREADDKSTSISKKFDDTGGFIGKQVFDDPAHKIALENATRAGKNSDKK